MTGCDFTLAHYESILNSVAQHGYSYRTFSVAASRSVADGKNFYLRHDIDIDRYAALSLARIENSVGARATYFFLPTSPYYNLASLPTRGLLRQIIELGGEVQLHFDAAPFAHVSQEEVEVEIDRQAKWLSACCEEEITAVSFHRPAPNVLGQDLAGFTSAYSRYFFKQTLYVSDSAGHWRNGCVCQHVANQADIQCLIHPVWWGEREADINERLREYYDVLVGRCREWLSQEIRTYSPGKPPVVSADPNIQ